MKHLFLTLVMLLSLVTARRDKDVMVGDIGIGIPSPEGFSLVTPEMKLLNALGKHFVPSGNVEYAKFIPDRDVPAALKDELTDLPRRFAVQAHAGSVGASATESDFRDLRKLVEVQNKKMVEKLESEFPGMVQRINEGLAVEFGAKVSLRMPRIIPLPVHEETDRSIAFSMLGEYEFTEPGGGVKVETTASTITFVHVRGKIVFLYCWADESDLKWSREASSAWSKAFLAANPPEAKQSSIDTSRPSGGSFRPGR